MAVMLSIVNEVAWYCRKLGLHNSSLFGPPGPLRGPWLMYVASAYTFLTGPPIPEPYICMPSSESVLTGEEHNIKGDCIVTQYEFQAIL